MRIGPTNLHMVRIYALPYHPTSLSEWNSSVIRGIAVEMIFWSCISSQDFGSNQMRKGRNSCYQSHQENGQVQSCHDDDSFLIAGILWGDDSGFRNNCLDFVLLVRLIWFLEGALLVT
jgi:hypothetical protein